MSWMRLRVIHISLLGFTLLVAAFFYGIPPIPQDPAYHHFADQRTRVGIPHFWNVVSKLPFVMVGLLGVLQSRRGRLPGGLPGFRTHYVLFFLGMVLVGFGSGYYHLAPSNRTLVWDRLPMLFLPVLLLGYPSAVAGSGYIWAALAAYTVAKLLEWQDAAVLHVLGQLSGHSLKHVSAAAAGYLFLLALERRHLLGTSRAAGR
jgi:hypothetical protein